MDVPATRVRTIKVERPALLARLDGALSAPLTIIVASAGAGKTTLLDQWVTSLPSVTFGRLEVDEGDNDPVRFASRLLNALSVIDPVADDVRKLILLHANGLGVAMIDALGAHLRFSPECVFIFDDLHRVSNPVLLADLMKLLRVLPVQVHVVVSSRTDRSFSWSRRVGDDVVEIRQEDLAFSHAEATKLLEQITGSQFSPELVDTLIERTEGWTAGLQLAAVNLRHRNDPDQFVAQFNGSDRLIVDYLTQQILDVQVPSRRVALLQMSVIDRMSAGLVNVLTGRGDAQLVFEELERDSMFLVALDSTRTEFRFHQLFREMLRYRLRAAYPAMETELLAAAATWHLERGEVHQAVQYLLRAKDWERVIDVVMTRMVEVYERGEMLTVIHWIEEIPDRVREQHLDVWILLGMLWGMEGQIAKAEDILNRLLVEPRSTAGQRKVAAAYLTARVYFAGRPDASISAAQRALRVLREDDGTSTPNLLNVTEPRLLETLALVSGARAYFLAGELDEASRWANHSLRSDGISYPLYCIGALGTRALKDAWAGRLNEARVGAREAIALARDVGALFHPVIADAYLALTQVALEQGNPSDAALSLHEGVVRSSSNRRDQLMWITRLQSAERTDASDPEGDVRAMLDAFSEEASTAPPPIVANRLLALRSRALRRAAAPEAALRELSRSDQTDPSILFELVASALTLEQNERARALLTQWARAVDNVPLENVQHLVLRAWLAVNEGDKARARLRLNAAFDLAQPEGLVEAFIRAGSTVLAMVASQTGAHEEFRARIIDRAREARMPLPATDLAEPLTDRELEILSHLPSRRKNADLADLCFVSLSTIKTHLANIYRKLDVTTRDAAIIRAQELGLL